MTWKPYAALACQAVAAALFVIAGHNLAIINVPEGPGLLSPHGAGVALLGVMACGCNLLGWSLLGNAPASSDKPHLAPVGRQIGDAAARGDFEAAQRLLDALKPGAAK